MNENKIPTDLRKWIYCDKGKVYCVYCFCISTLSLNALIEGVNTNQLVSMITKALRNHEISSIHKISKHKYLKFISEFDDASTIVYNETSMQNRAIIKVVLKIVIFLATHGKFP